MSHPRVVQPAHLFTAFAALALGCGGDGNASDTTDADVVDAADGGRKEASTEVRAHGVMRRQARARRNYYCVGPTRA